MVPTRACFHAVPVCPNLCGHPLLCVSLVVLAPSVRTPPVGPSRMRRQSLRVEQYTNQAVNGPKSPNLPGGAQVQTPSLLAVRQ